MIIAIRTIEDMIEPAIGLSEREKIFRQRVTAFHKTAVVQRNPQFTERDNDLCDGFDIGRSPRRKAALAVLHIGQISQCLICRGFDRFLVLIFCQCLKRHSGNIHVGIRRVGQRPTAVFILILDDLINVELPRGLCLCGGIFRNLIIPGIQRD